MNKQQKELLYARAEKAVENCYHNATPNWPSTRNDYEWDMMERAWYDQCNMDIDDINNGLDEYWKDLVEMFGKVYTWGRGGRTCVPEGLVRQCGGSSFRMRTSWYEERSVSFITEGILLIEKWNKFVEDYNKGCPTWWKETKEANEYEETIIAHDGKHKVMVECWR